MSGPAQAGVVSSRMDSGFLGWGSRGSRVQDRPSSGAAELCSGDVQATNVANGRGPGHPAGRRPRSKRSDCDGPL